jgi:hypothetical protein
MSNNEQCPWCGSTEKAVIHAKCKHSREPHEWHFVDSPITWFIPETQVPRRTAEQCRQEEELLAKVRANCGHLGTRGGICDNCGEYVPD